MGHNGIGWLVAGGYNGRNGLGREKFGIHKTLAQWKQSLHGLKMLKNAW